MKEPCRPATLSFVILYLLTQIYYFCAAYLGAAEPLCKSKVCKMKKIMKENHVVPDEVLNKEWLSQFKTEADVSKFLK